jgi:hypothetical protein
MQRILQITMLTLVACGMAAAESNVDPAHKRAWGENIGWTNWRDAGSPSGASGVRFSEEFLAGYVWSENVGWINLGDGTPEAVCEGMPCYANVNGTDFGVNVDPGTGELYGMAWGENIGWINFEGGAWATPSMPAAVDFCTRQVTGFVWGENVGWINLDDSEHYVSLGPCAPGDYDCDGDQDLDDHMVFAILISGPDVPADCPSLDQDADTDLDLEDFAAFQNAVSGI